MVSWVGLECRLQQRLGVIVAATLEPCQDGRSRALVGMQFLGLPTGLLDEPARFSLDRVDVDRACDTAIDPFLPEAPQRCGLRVPGGALEPPVTQRVVDCFARRSLVSALHFLTYERRQVPGERDADLFDGGHKVTRLDDRVGATQSHHGSGVRAKHARFCAG